MLVASPAVAEEPSVEGVAGPEATGDQQAPLHPLTAADLEGRGAQPGGPVELVDYYLGPVALSQDYLARDLVMLTRTQVFVLRVRGGSVAQLNEQTLAALRVPPARIAVARRSVPPRLRLPRSLALHGPLLRMLAAGVSEQVDDIRVRPPSRGELFMHVTLSYRGGTRRQEVGAGRERLEEALIEAFSSLFPRGRGL